MVWGKQRLFHRALATVKTVPAEMTDRAAVYPAVLDELIPSAWHHIERHANNPIESDHAQLKRRLRAMRGPRTDRTAHAATARAAADACAGRSRNGVGTRGSCSARRMRRTYSSTSLRSKKTGSSRSRTTTEGSE